MNCKAIPLCLVLLSFELVVVGCGGGAPALDMGDGSRGYLLYGASHHLSEDRDLAKSVAYADKALELYGDEARSMQESLSGFPATDPPEATFKYQTLNNAGLSVLLKAYALRQMGDLDGATEANTMVIQDFGYAQVQELGEWQVTKGFLEHDAMGFVKIADVARKSIAEIEAGGS